MFDTHLMGIVKNMKIIISREVILMNADNLNEIRSCIFERIDVSTHANEEEITENESHCVGDETKVCIEDNIFKNLSTDDYESAYKMLRAVQIE